jgi:hypothetical protein
MGRGADLGWACGLAGRRASTHMANVDEVPEHLQINRYEQQVLTAAVSYRWECPGREKTSVFRSVLKKKLSDDVKQVISTVRRAVRRVWNRR